MNEKCMKCGKPATHKFVRIEGNQVYDMFYCPKHAAEASPYQQPKTPLSEILATLLSQEQAAQPRGQSIRCRTCGLPFEAYKKTLFLGCPDCYESFFEQLLPEMHRMHGNTKHVGRKPGGGKETAEEGGHIVPITFGLPSPSEPEPEPIQPAPAPLVELDAEPKPKDPAREVLELTAQMNKAIAAEDFETAAKCRDQINELRGKLKKDPA